jgi:hypothetical protein
MTLDGGHTMPGKADIVTYVILGVFALAIIVWAMMNTGYKGPG